MTKPKNIRTEAAQREVMREYVKGRFARWARPLYQKKTILIEVAISNGKTAIFDLRDCFRKRKPLTGATKALRKILNPRGKKK